MGRRLIDVSLMEEAELKGSVRRMFIARYLNGMLYEQSEQG